MVQLRVRVQFQLRVEFRVRVQLKLGMKFRVRVQLMVRVLFGVRIKFRVSVKFRKELVQGELRLPSSSYDREDFFVIFIAFVLVQVRSGPNGYISYQHVLESRSDRSTYFGRIRTDPERPCIDSIQLTTGQNFRVRIVFLFDYHQCGIIFSNSLLWADRPLSHALDAINPIWLR